MNGGVAENHDVRVFSVGSQLRCIVPLSGHNGTSLPGTLGDMADAPEPLSTPEPLSNRDLKVLVKAVLAREGGILGIVLVVAPTVVFFVVDTLTSLPTALIASLATAVVALGLQLIRRRTLRQAGAGFVIAGVSASVAALTGQAKGFFLFTTLGTGALSAVLFGTVLVGRPLAGRLLNRIVGGRPDWYRNRRALRVYSAITTTWAILNSLWFVLHVWAYLVNLTAGLAVMSVTGPILMAIALVASIVVARRVVHTEPEPEPAASAS
jgi:hypothetical protein